VGQFFLADADLYSANLHRLPKGFRDFHLYALLLAKDPSISRACQSTENSL
jgi:hypothetical protein